MEMRVYEREKLYKEIWAEPMTKVAKRYNVSDVAIKKNCKKLNIPVPGRGHWARVYACEKINTPALPENKGNDKIIINDYSKRSSNKSSSGKKTDKLKFLKEEQRESIIEYCSAIMVHNELEKPHSLIKDTIQYFKSRNDSTKPPVSRVFCIKATEEQKTRVYRILDTMFKAFEYLGYNTVLNAPKSQYYGSYEPRVWDNVIKIQLDKDMAQISIKEMQHRVPHIPTEKEIEENKRYSFMKVPEYDIVHNGRLNFIIDEHIAKRKNWRDGDKHRLENDIGNIILTIMEAINDRKILRERSEIETIMRKEEEGKRAILHKRQANEQIKVNQLISNANDYYQALKVYEYVAAIEKVLSSIENVATIEQIKDHIDWAKQKADWLNPLVARKDELLGKKHNYVILETIDEEDGKYIINE
jgi:hypothetical protein